MKVWGESDVDVRMNKYMPTTTSTATRHRRTPTRVSADHPNYKWWALSCTSAGMLLAAMNSGTLIIALRTSSAR